MGLFEFLVMQALTLSFEIDISKKELMCMSQNIWHEARGEDILGWAKVAQTVRNRMGDPSYPETACGVIWDSGQFEWTEDSHSDSVEPVTYEDGLKLQEIIQISASAYAGHFDGIINGSVMYWNPDKASPCWESAFNEFIDYGNHRWAYDSNGTTPCFNKYAKYP